MPQRAGLFLIENARPDTVFTREDLSAEQRLFGDTAAEFMRREVFPHARRLYSHDWTFARELLRKAGELDLLRLEIPEAHGGLGLDKVSAAYVFEQIGLEPSFGSWIGAHTGIGTMPLLYFGNEEQRARYLPRLASGEMIAAYALTESHSGSDALAARTTARLHGDHYVLNGRKMWITNGGAADLFTIFAKIDGTKLTGFLVERGMGVVSGPDEAKLGLDGSSTCELILDDVRVPVANVLGAVGEGHRVALNTLNLGRVKLGSRNLACAKQALANATRYARERQQFGRPIAEFGLIQHKLAEMTIRCFVGDAMVYRTLGDVDRAMAGSTDALTTIEGFAVECSMNKVATSETLAYVVDETLQIFGGNGYSREFPAERAYRDARITRIYEGTNEINRLQIATRTLRSGLPDELPEATSLLGSAKGLVVAMLSDVARVYGEQLREEQEVLALLADVLIDVYAWESAAVRTAKLVDRGDAVLATDMLDVFVADAVDRIVRAFRQLGRRLGGLESPHLAPLTAFVGTDPVAARRRIAQATLEAKAHPL